MKRSLLLLVFLGGPLGSLSCSGNVSRGRALYADGYYVEAAEVFERNEGRLSEWPPEKRAAYGLYRSMTLFELGDVEGAARWLRYCEWVQGSTPGSLDAQQLTLVARMHAKLETQQPVAPPAPSSDAVAAQNGQSPAPVSGVAPALTPTAAPPGAPAAPAQRRGLVP